MSGFTVCWAVSGVTTTTPEASTGVGFTPCYRPLLQEHLHHTATLSLKHSQASNVPQTSLFKVPRKTATARARERPLTARHGLIWNFYRINMMPQQMSMKRMSCSVRGRRLAKRPLLSSPCPRRPSEDQEQESANTALQTQLQCVTIFRARPPSLRAS